MDNGVCLQSQRHAVDAVGFGAVFLCDFNVLHMGDLWNLSSLILFSERFYLKVTAFLKNFFNRTLCSSVFIEHLSRVSALSSVRYK